jgi:hypothetical protein
MSDSAPDPRNYFIQQLPGQFERALREQEEAVRAAAGGPAPAAEEAQRVLDGMRSVNATIVFEVRGEGGGTFFLNVVEGRLIPGDRATQPVAITLVQGRSGYDRLIADAGSSALGFLGGLSGLGGEMKLTRARIDLLQGVAGTLDFEVTGDTGFSLISHFGPGEPHEPPDTRIRVAPEIYGELRAGRLDAQHAFVGGKLEIEGDMQLAINVALAAMAPD